MQSCWILHSYRFAPVCMHVLCGTRTHHHDSQVTNIRKKSQLAHVHVLYIIRSRDKIKIITIGTHVCATYYARTPTNTPATVVTQIWWLCRRYWNCREFGTQAWTTGWARFTRVANGLKAWTCRYRWITQRVRPSRFCRSVFLQGQSHAQSCACARGNAIFLLIFAGFVCECIHISKHKSVRV